jgi:hypothetical protein
MPHLSPREEFVPSRYRGLSGWVLVIALMTGVTLTPTIHAAEESPTRVLVEVHLDGTCHVQFFLKEEHIKKARHPCKQLGNVVASRISPEDAGSIALDAWATEGEYPKADKALTEALRSLTGNGFSRFWFPIH